MLGVDSSMLLSSGTGIFPILGSSGIGPGRDHLMDAENKRNAIRIRPRSDMGPL